LCCGFANQETKIIVNLCCLNVGVCSTAQAIVDTLNQFIEKHGFDCVKHTAVATVAIGNPERHVRKASHRGSMQQ